MKATLTLEDGTTCPVFIVDGTYKRTRQAIYTGQQEWESAATLEPAAVVDIEIACTLEVECLGPDMDAVAAKLIGEKVIRADLSVEGVR